MVSGYSWVDVDFNNNLPTRKYNESSSTTTLDSQYSMLSAKLRETVEEFNEPPVRQQAGLGERKPQTSLKCGKRPPTVMAPAVCKFKEIYETHKEKLRRDVEHDMRKKCEFHSHPLPNFKRLHERLKKHSVVNVRPPTVPVTPKTLLASEETKKKLELKRLESEKEFEAWRKSNRIKAKSIAYFRRQPFLPQIPEPSIVQTKPFQFHTPERAEKRNRYNAEAKQILEWQIDQQRWEANWLMQREHKILRKLTEFKARPNPWKKLDTFTRAPITFN